MSQSVNRIALLESLNAEHPRVVPRRDFRSVTRTFNVYKGSGLDKLIKAVDHDVGLLDQIDDGHEFVACRKWLGMLGSLLERIVSLHAYGRRHTREQYKATIALDDLLTMASLTVQHHQQ